MKAQVFLATLALTFVSQLRADFFYDVSNLQPWNNPSEAIPMNLSSPGDIVTITGTGFGDRDVNDAINEMLYVANQSTGGLWMIYRGMYDSSGPHYFGIMSWTDNEIRLEVAHGFGPLMGSFVILKTQTSINDNGGTSVRGTLSTIPGPASFSVSGMMLLSSFFRRRR